MKGIYNVFSNLCFMPLQNEIILSMVKAYLYTGAAFISHYKLLLTQSHAFSGILLLESTYTVFDYNYSNQAHAPQPASASNGECAWLILSHPQGKLHMGRN